MRQLFYAPATSKEFIQLHCPSDLTELKLFIQQLELLLT